MGRKSTTSSKMRRNKSTQPQPQPQPQSQPQPQKSNLPQPQPQPSVNNTHGLLNNVAQGAAMGVGMSMGHSIFNSISSYTTPNDDNTNPLQNTALQHSPMNRENRENREMDLNPITNHNCEQEMNEFQKCLNKNQGQLNFCKEYYNMLDICRGNNFF